MLPPFVTHRYWSLGLLLSLLSVLPRAEAQTNAAAATNSPPARFEKEIQAFEDADRLHPPPADAILFVGSSTIRLWSTLTNDFADWPVINRGFGGSHIPDVTAFASRIIFPYNPRTIVFYAGDNDLADGHSAAKVVADYHEFTVLVHARLPRAKVLFLAIKPSLKRWQLHEQALAVNQAIASLPDPWLGFIDTYPPMLGEAGRPRPELYQEDGLHMTSAGYAIWTGLIRPRLR